MKTESPGLSVVDSCSRNCVISPCLTMIISSWPGCLWNAWPSPGSRVTSMITSVFAPRSGVSRQPMTPQSKFSWRTSLCFTNELIGLLSEGNGLEALHVLGHCLLDGEAFHRRGAEEADDTFGALDHERGIVRLGDRAAVAEDEDVVVDAFRRVVHLLDQWHALLERLRRRRADRTAGGETHVRHEHVGARLGHRRRSPRGAGHRGAHQARGPPPRPSPRPGRARRRKAR